MARDKKGRGKERFSEFEEEIIKVNRCAAVVKGGRRFSFSALVAVGNRKGMVGLGFGKANDVPSAVEKAHKDAVKSMITVPLNQETITHQIRGRFGAAKVILVPAAPGTGVIAGKTVKAICELAGIRNLLTKSFGSNTPVNLAKAVITGLNSLKTPEKKVEKKQDKTEKAPQKAEEKAEKQPEKTSQGA